MQKSDQPPTDHPTADQSQDVDAYITAMLESFENDNPSIAELLALHQDAMRYHSQARKPKARKIISYSMTGNQ